MEILAVLLVASLAITCGSVGFFVWTVKKGTYDHSDRLALLPLCDEDTTSKHAHPELGHSKSEPPEQEKSE